jgi:hypothetical protein
VSTLRYDVHGVVVDVASEHPGVAAAVAARLRHFPAGGDGAPDVRFRYRVAPGASGHALEPPPGAGRRVYDTPTGDVRYFAAADVLHVDGGDVRVLCAARRGEVDVSSIAPGQPDLWLLSRPLLTLPLVELLKRRGRFSVHAGGVVAADRAVLLPGASGAGKSTLAVALARAGMPFLADDMVFLSAAADGLRAHAFPDEADVSDATAGWFPELRGLAGRIPPGWSKHRVRVEEVFGTPVATVCEPGLLLFPSITTEERSSVSALSPGEALRELAPNVLLTDPAASQAHLDALAALARGCRAYRLAAARDFDRIAELVRSLAER